MRIELVWVRPERGLVLRLEREPLWRPIHRDVVSVRFRCEGPAAAGPSRGDMVLARQPVFPERFFLAVVLDADPPRVPVGTAFDTGRLLPWPLLA